MDHNHKRRKVFQMPNFHNSQKLVIASSSNITKAGTPSTSVLGEAIGTSQIWVKLREIFQILPWLRSRAHSLQKSTTALPITAFAGQRRNRSQALTALPANHFKPVRLRLRRCLPFVTSWQVAPLVKRLKDTRLTVRAEGARRLGELGKCAPVEPLLDALDDKERFVRAEAARALGNLGERVVSIDPLINALHDKDGSVRVAAAQALGILGKLESVEKLRQALSDPWPPVREALVLALGNFGEHVPPETFQPFLQDEDKFVRTATVLVLETRMPSNITGISDKHKKPLKIITSRLVASQSVEVVIVGMPNWVRENIVVFIIVCIVLGIAFLFSQKKRILSIVTDSTPRISRLLQMPTGKRMTVNALAQKGT